MNISASNAQVGRLTLCPSCSSYARVLENRSSGLQLRRIFKLSKPVECSRCLHSFWQEERWHDFPQRVPAWLVLVLTAFAVLNLMVLTMSRTQASADPVGAAINPTIIEEQVVVYDLESKKTAAKFVQASSDNAMAFHASAQSRLEAAEQELLIRSELMHDLEMWRKAWQHGDTSNYFSAYVDGYSPKHVSGHDEWREQRLSRISPKTHREITIEGFDADCDFAFESCVVEFHQRYVSGSYKDKVKKQLAMRQIDGKWRIVKETTI